MEKMADQELQMIKPEFQDSDFLDPINRFAFINLETSPTTTDQCTMYYGKRRSPSSSSLDDPSTTSDSERKPKKIMVEDDHLFRGFTKISLPISYSFPNGPSMPSYPVLRRCSSDPYSSPETFKNAGAPTTQLSDSLARSCSFANPQSPDVFGKINGNAIVSSPARVNSSASLPPLPPTFRRSVSDLSAFQTPVVLSRSSSSKEMDVGAQVQVNSNKEESPNSLRLRRIKDRMKEMSQWVDEVLLDREDGGSVDNNSSKENNNSAKIVQDGSASVTQEDVRVENVGECLSIHFKCPCGAGYQILLSGRNCFYKLA